MHKTTRKKGRRKMVTTGAITSRKLAKITSVTELLYWRIYMASDNYGTMSADPWDVQHEAVPGKCDIDSGVVTQSLDELVDVGLLERWSEADETTWIHVVQHDEHQEPQWLKKRGRRLSPIPPSLAFSRPPLGEDRDHRDVYLVEARGTGRAKIGVSGDVTRRVAQMMTGSSQDLEVLAVWPGGGPEGEREFMTLFAAHKLRHEWFQLQPEMVEWVKAGPDRVVRGLDLALNAGSCEVRTGSSPPTSTTREEETDERARQLPEQVAPPTTESFALEQAIAIFLDCSRGGIDESMWRSQLEQHRSRHVGAPIERYVDAAMQMRAKALDSGRPFTMSSGWSWFQKAWSSLAADEHGTAKRFSKPAEPERKRRSAADVLAAQADVWGPAA